MARYILSGLILTAIIPLWGLLMYLIKQVVFRTIGALAGGRMAAMLVNWLTIPGVVHHELSHALFALITGAKITEMKLFYPDPQDGSLGHVNFAARGNFLLRAIQYTFVASAPVIMGTVTCVGTFLLLKGVELSTGWLILIGYLLFSILIHASMSGADVRIMFKGIWVMCVVAMIVCAVFQVDLISLLPAIGR